MYWQYVVGQSCFSSLHDVLEVSELPLDEQDLCDGVFHTELEAFEIIGALEAQNYNCACLLLQLVYIVNHVTEAEGGVKYANHPCVEVGSLSLDVASVVDP